MTVGTFDPNASSSTVDAQLIERACGVASHVTSEIDLSSEEIQSLSVLATYGGWAEWLPELSDQQVEDLVRLFTLGEMQYPAWAADDKSPVVIFVKALKQRGVDTVELKRWIKTNTTNKFLPHGSLMDRL